MPELESNVEKVATDTAAADHDERLAAVIGEMTDAVMRGEMVDIDQACRDHPELTADLRELWGAAMLADAIGLQVKEESNSPTPESDVVPVEESPSAIFELPYKVGDYELLEEIGRGGMGVVYRARQLSLSRDVAVKMILRGQLASEADRARFRAEAEAAARLNHPGIVPVYDVAEHDGILYFSMKYIQGETLSQRLSAGPLSSRESARILEQVARAIHFAHRHGILHRDLKPSNILLDEEGNPHVTDFGLAKQVRDGESLTKTGAVLGTPTYMPPEQATGRGKMGPPSDVYSLGSILYHTLTGRPPFQAASAMDVVLMVLEQDPVPPRILNPKADRDLEMVALRCLQKPMDLRYETAEALADDLHAYLNDESISARSGRFGQVVARLFRETHHAAVLENWGLLWMWHSLVLFILCIATNVLFWIELHSTLIPSYLHRPVFFIIWVPVALAWAWIFWRLRRQQGPVTFVERQIAHVWAASMIGIGLLFPIEFVLDWHLADELPVLVLSPVLALFTGMIFLTKAGILSGYFYPFAFACFAVAIPMAMFPEFAHLMFGVVASLCFFLPGLKYYRQKRRSDGA